MVGGRHLWWKTTFGGSKKIKDDDWKNKDESTAFIRCSSQEVNLIISRVDWIGSQAFLNFLIHLSKIHSFFMFKLPFFKLRFFPKLPLLSNLFSTFSLACLYSLFSLYSLFVLFSLYSCYCLYSQHSIFLLFSLLLYVPYLSYIPFLCCIP